MKLEILSCDFSHINNSLKVSRDVLVIETA